MSYTQNCDLLVIGSGAAGLCAAVSAARRGLNVIVAEKESVLGGSTAWSGGWMWVPCTKYARLDGNNENSDIPETYLRHELGDKFDETRVKALLEAGPEMIDFLEEDPNIRFYSGTWICDIHGNTLGAGTGSRSVVAAPVDGRKLGNLWPLLRRPMRETTLYGMGIQAGPDLRAFLNARRSVPALLHVTYRLGRHFSDLLRYGRGTQLVNGNALVARLMLSAKKAGVHFLVSSPAKRLLTEEGTIKGAILKSKNDELTVRTGIGVILATGGFPHDVERRKTLFPNTPTGEEHWTVAAPGTSGDGLSLAEAAGAAIDTAVASPAAWCPVSLVPFKDGTVGHYPHIIERAKPGIIAVRANGRRFGNEADGYYDYITNLFRSLEPGEKPVSWLICTRAFQRRWGLGYSRPAPFPLRPYIRSGYITESSTIQGLARKCGISPEGLEKTINSYNHFAHIGQDPKFGRGSTPFNRSGGDPSQKPNPCVMPIEKGPYLAIRIVPGSFGTFAGVRADSHARALDHNDQPVPGLWVAGSDQVSVMGGYYPSGGINLGPAMTFGYIAGRDASLQCELLKSSS
ncbi:FAD-dependent oxidoreductase [Acetobacter senegalensis]|uniref:FAD-dependent oxidoreductase n=1 Tax=Acetobacter senegalensis TaxID=446692 RepID=UPI00209E4C5A|nr:FAD-dependent oxidoreductase [Acetobacter senegalensis]MCP1196049.1 FAD-dependent oxidoreductase [Acetobacter senegalensis]